MVLSDRAAFPLALQLRSGAGVPLGDLFSFVSGLYFRGKLAYARTFASPPRRAKALTGGGVLVITPCAGLQPADTPVTLDVIRRFAAVDVRADNRAYRAPLESSAKRLLARVGRSCDVVLLGSIASPKYIDVLAGVFGDRLRFPAEFVGRGDMSRGGLLLRQAAVGCELEYVPVIGAVLHGQRPPKLEPLAK